MLLLTSIINLIIVMILLLFIIKGWIKENPENHK